MSDARLRLAFAGLHPDRTRRLLETQHPERAVRTVRARSKSEQVRAAVEIDAATRRAELKRLGIVFIPRGARDFPNHLAELPDAPDGLFVRGSLPLDRGVAVIGTRRCTQYGRRLAEHYGAAIARAGWPLMSGLARGIDGAAHRGTVAEEGVGVAVLGCGLDIDYPREHGGLATRLVELGGAIVSEYPPGTPPEGWRFPRGTVNRTLRCPLPAAHILRDENLTAVDRCPERRGVLKEASGVVRRRRLVGSLGAILIGGVSAWLAFGFCAIQTLFIGQEVDVANPFVAGRGSHRRAPLTVESVSP